MARVSATFNRSTEGVAKAYAKFNQISFSEAVEILTASAGLIWLDKLPRDKKKEYITEFEIIKPIK